MSVIGLVSFREYDPVSIRSAHTYQPLVIRIKVGDLTKIKVKFQSFALFLYYQRCVHMSVSAVPSELDPISPYTVPVLPPYRFDHRLRKD